MVYVTLFFSALVSATLFPMGSEALLVYDIEQGHPLVWLVAIATFGNTLGAVINYWLGLGGEVLLEEKGLINPIKFAKFNRWFAKYGGWSLLLSWMPFIGDLFTFAAGIAKYSFWKFLLLVAIAKLGRYLVLAWAWITI
ncbi:MAG: DedA family protein [Sulfurovum sp.]|nr:DedA family protein [Sulfurovum sp.]